MALFMALLLLLIEHIVAAAAAWVLALADEAVGFMLSSFAWILDFVVVGEAAKTLPKKRLFVTKPGRESRRLQRWARQIDHCHVMLDDRYVESM